MKQTQVYDARSREHITAEGSQLRLLLKSRINTLLDAQRTLMTRMNNEITDKAEAVSLLVALRRGGEDLSERALFIKACAERAAQLEDEVSLLNTLGNTFVPGREYRISIEDAIRFGI